MFPFSRFNDSFERSFVQVRVLSIAVKEGNFKIYKMLHRDYNNSCIECLSNLRKEAPTLDEERNQRCDHCNGGVRLVLCACVNVYWVDLHSTPTVPGLLLLFLLHQRFLWLLARSPRTLPARLALLPARTHLASARAAGCGSG